MYLNSGQEFVITGERSNPGVIGFLQVIHQHYLPNKIVIGEVNDLPSFPILENKIRTEGSPTAYLCENYICNQPTTQVNELTKQILMSAPK